jgi:CheY-like chemotaxis protein
MTTALVIDDHRDAADTVCRMLGLLDVNAKPAYGPREAMMLLKDYSPDIVFLDINMPGVDGFEVLSYLKRFPHMANTPIVFVTSDDQPETAGRVRKTGALLIIIKPATIESLEAALKKAGLIR